MIPHPKRLALVACLACLGGGRATPAEDAAPVALLGTRFHLTARPWTPVDAPRERLLDDLEPAVRSLAPYQLWDGNDPSNLKNGALIDPYNRAEVQYATPLFAFNVATLVSQGRAVDLLEAGCRALDRASLDISRGKANDHHGEFFAAPMVKALRLFESVREAYPDRITPDRVATWRRRMRADRTKYMNMNVKQNWRTFAMKGEWLRQREGMIGDGAAWIEANWTRAAEGGQRERFRRDRDRYGLDPYFFLYHDDTADPETFAYNGATTANLLDLLEGGYDGPSAADMRATVEHSLRSSLLLLGGSGEAPAGGRTGEHIWDDTIYAVGFEMMAESAARAGDARRAGQFRRAAQLLYLSHRRFLQEPGWFSITKNGFHPSLKRRYATWSGLTNYDGFTQACLAESFLARQTAIPEQPTPAEVGGYAVALDPEFGSVFLNAGGMQAQLCTRGEVDAYGGVQWHTLGITRFSRAGFDSRLGPGAGHAAPDLSEAIGFGPEFREGGRWVRVAQQPRRFQGRFRAEFVHPLLVRGVFTLAPVAGQSGPTFDLHLTLTPDGVLVDAECATPGVEFGVTWPLLAFDGRTVPETPVGALEASTSYPPRSRSAVAQQAESAAMAGAARIASDQPGHAGAGFVRFEGAGSVEWAGLDGGDGGPSTVGLRYALGVPPKDVRSARLVVNGGPPVAATFPSTGGRDAWHLLELPVTLRPGPANVVRLEVEAPGDLQVDEARGHPGDGAATPPDAENFLALQPTHRLDASGPVVAGGGYGDFRPVRATDAAGGRVETFVYPRGAGDPPGDAVRASFRRDGADFRSILGRVRGTTYVGRTAAGGVGASLDLDDNGTPDVSFDRPCAFVLQRRDGRIVAVEADRAVRATLAGRTVTLEPFVPVAIEAN